MIRKAKASEIVTLLKITKACGAAMKAQHIFQWNEAYPNKEAFVKDLSRGELYVLSIKDVLIGCITISTFKDEEYEEISWLTKESKQYYIHRLAVHPEHQRKGYAQQLMDFAETKATHENFTSVRLDTFSENKRNQIFYEKRGYQKLGTIYFPKQSEAPFYCYELVL